MWAFTDYPTHSKYKNGEYSTVEIISYDGDKYCTVRTNSGIEMEIKRHYLYKDAFCKHPVELHKLKELAAN